jgi:hypothetical protein
MNDVLNVDENVEPAALPDAEMTRLEGGIYEIWVRGSGQGASNALFDMILKAHREQAAEDPKSLIRFVIHIDTQRDLSIRELTARSRIDRPHWVCPSRSAMVANNNSMWNFVMRVLNGMRLVKDEVAYFQPDEREKAIAWLNRPRR